MPSYSPVFSAQFINYGASTPNTEFEVPSGFTAVVRDVSAFAQAGATVFDVRYQNDEDSPSIVFWGGNPIGIWVPSQWQGRVVVPELGIISLGVESVDESFTCYVGGYLLRNTLT